MKIAVFCCGGATSQALQCAKGVQMFTANLQNFAFFKADMDLALIVWAEDPVEMFAVRARCEREKKPFVVVRVNEKGEFRHSDLACDDTQNHHI